MRRSGTLTLQGWLLAILLPSLGLLVVAYAVLVFVRLNRVIQDGFDRKLEGVSSTVAAFIDPIDHERLIGPLPLSSLARDATRPLLWALDLSRHELVKIRPGDGFAEDTGITMPAELDNITTDLTTDTFLFVDNSTGHFQRFHLTTHAFQPAFDVEPPVYCVTSSSVARMLFAAGRDLRRVNLDTSQVTVLGPAPEKLRDLALDPNHGALWALSDKGNEVLQLNTTSGAVIKRVKLTFASQDDAAIAGTSGTEVDLRTIIYDRFGDRLLGTVSSLLVIDTNTGTVSARGFLPSFGQEQGPAYKRYAAPMSRIISHADLTYLYTQIVQGHDHIVYGLDGTVGKDHSPLLSTDTVRPAEISGVQRLMTEGVTYISDVEPWPPWGLLKSAFAPIFDEQGRPVAMAGADVNADLIQIKIRRALVFTFGFGTLTLAVAGVLALLLARRLTGPLNAIKAAALEAAAGDFNLKVQVNRPVELRDMARQLSAAAAQLGREMKAFDEAFGARQLERDRAGLTESLGRLPGLALAAPAGRPWAWGGLGPAPESGAPSGAVQHGAGTLIWIAAASAGGLAGASRRAEIALTAETLLARHGPDPAALEPALRGLFPDEIAAWALPAPDGLRVILRRGGLLVRWKQGAGAEEPAPAGFSSLIRAQPGEALVLASPGAPFASFPPGATGSLAAALLEQWRRGASGAGADHFALIWAGE